MSTTKRLIIKWLLLTGVVLFGFGFHACVYYTFRLAEQHVPVPEQTQQDELNPDRIVCEYVLSPDVTWPTLHDEDRASITKKLAHNPTAALRDLEEVILNEVERRVLADEAYRRPYGENWTPDHPQYFGVLLSWMDNNPPTIVLFEAYPLAQEEGPDMVTTFAKNLKDKKVLGYWDFPSYKNRSVRAANQKLMENFMKKYLWLRAA